MHRLEPILDNQFKPACVNNTERSQKYAIAEGILQQRSSSEEGCPRLSDPSPLLALFDGKPEGYVKYVREYQQDMIDQVRAHLFGSEEGDLDLAGEGHLHPGKS